MSAVEKKMAYFPLSISLLPGEDIPLRIFEPRYKQLINECKEKGITFGIPYMKGSEIKKFGSEVKLRQVVAENSLGEMVIVVEGVSVFQVLSYEKNMENKLYAGGKVRLFDGNSPIRNRELMQMLIHYTDHVDPDFLKKITKNEIFLQDVAIALNLSSEDKYTYISINDIFTKEKFLLVHMRYLLRLREQEALLKNDFGLN